jgi:hypothetical protein
VAIIVRKAVLLAQQLIQMDMLVIQIHNAHLEIAKTMFAAQLEKPVVHLILNALL